MVLQVLERKKNYDNTGRNAILIRVMRMEDEVL